MVRISSLLNKKMYRSYFLNKYSLYATYNCVYELNCVYDGIVKLRRNQKSSKGNQSLVAGI